MKKILSRFIDFGTGTDQTNARLIPANFTPTEYVPAQVAAEGDDKISAHLRGIDNYLDTLTPENVLIVQTNPGPGQFSSIKAAIDSITTATSSNRFAVLIGPGVYTEDTITMKPFVYVQGSDDSTTIIQPDDPTKTLIVGSPNSEIKQIQLRGATGAGGRLIYYRNLIPSLAIFSVVECAFGSAETIMRIEGDGFPTVLRMEGSRLLTDAIFTNGFIVDRTGVGVTLAFLRGLVYQNLTGPYPTTLFSVSAGAQMVVDSTIVKLGGMSGTAAIASDGGILDLNSVAFDGFALGLYSENAGSAPRINSSGVTLRNNTQDILVDHPATIGNFLGAATTTKVTINSDDFTVSFSDLTDTGITLSGPLRFGRKQSYVTDTLDLLEGEPGMGVQTGGQLSDGGGLTLNVTAGSGYAMVQGFPDHRIRKITWNNDSIVLPANSDRYIYYNNSGVLTSAAAYSDSAILILLGRVVTNGTGIELIEGSQIHTHHPINHYDALFRQALGPIYASGTTVTEDVTPFKLDVTAGSFFFSLENFQPSGGSPISFIEYYRDGLGGWNRTTTDTVTTNVIDDNSGVLQPMTVGYYAKHALYVVGDGANEQYFLVLAQAEYAALAAAEDAPLPIAPPWIRDGVAAIAAIIIQEGAANIFEVLDIRPRIGFSAAGVSASSDHGALLGLTDDDHPQYFLVDGSRAMTGNIDMGANSITNVNLVDGVDVSAHASRHQPNGADPIPTAAAVGVLPNNVNGAGVSNSLARADHIHALPNAAPITQTPDNANAVGTANNVARSDHVHNIPTASAVGLDATSTSTQGAAATFARSNHTHAIASGSAITQDATTVNGTGAAAEFARADHTHTLTTGTVVAQTPDQANAAGVGAALARADHVHNIPTAAAVGLDADSTNTQGGAATFSRSNHTHAIASGVVVSQTPDQANAAGTSANFARADHIHNIPTDVPITIVPNATNTQGVAATFSRADHGHAIGTAAPSTNLSATTTNTEGVSANFSRADHIHAILTGVVSTQTPDQANAAGTSANLARADHVHSIPTASAVGLDAASTSTQGNAATFARSNHTHAIASGVVSTQLADQANAAGTSANFARADHIHNIPTAIAVGSDANSVNSQGVSTSFSKADHVHAIASGVVSTQTPDQANAAGTSANFARADHIHNIPTAVPITIVPTASNTQGVAATFSRADHGHAIGTAAPSTSLSATTANTEGVSTSFSRADHVHAILTGVVSTQTPDNANAAGTSANLARADHVHNIPTATAVGLNAGTANAQGAAASFSRADHTHAIASGTPSTQLADQANATGVSTNFARADHIHNIPTAVAVGLNANSTSTQGASTSFAKADHTHAIASGVVSTQTPDQANAAGTSTNFARADHVHNIPTATAVSITSNANAQGVAATFARADHTHRITATAASLDHVARFDGSSWQAVYPENLQDLARVWSLRDDWASGFGNGSGWASTVTGGGSVVATDSTLVDLNHVGIVRITAGNANGRAAVISISPIMVLGGGVVTISVLFQLGTLTNATFRIGLGDVFTGADFNNGVYLEYNSAVSANWLIKTAAAGVRTTTTTATAATANVWHMLVITINAAASSVGYTLNGASLGTITTNIPTLATGPCVAATSNGGTLSPMFVDYYAIDQRFTTSR